MSFKVLLLAGNTYRARAYAQQLQEVNNQEIEVFGVFFGFSSKPVEDIVLNNQAKEYCNINNILCPDLSENIKETYRKNKWHYSEIDSVDVNSEEVIQAIKETECDIVVFAGYGGQILRTGHFKVGKNYLHMHPGKLPIERGSTTLYYSILNGRNCSVTAFYMTEKIDEGKNIICKEYPVPTKGVDMDYGFDNIIRADCFIEAIKALLNGKPPFVNDEESVEYYVIHPVLKHVALLSMKDVKKDLA